MDEKQVSQSVDDKLAKVKYSPDAASHLVANQQKCLKCKEKYCTIVCPASVYEWDSENKMLLIKHENCLECGACRIACDKSAIDWKYPRASYGITYKNS